VFIHGAVFAITGKAERPKVFCTYAKKINGHDKELEINQKLSVCKEVNIDDKQSLKNICRSILDTVAEVIKLQAQEQGLETKPIPIIFGKDSRVKYDLKKITKAFKDAFVEFYAAHGKKDVENLFKKTKIYLGNFGTTIFEGTNRSSATKTDLAEGIIQQQNEEPYPEINQVLALLKTKAINGHKKSIRLLSNFAYDAGRANGITILNEDNPDQRFAYIYCFDKKLQDYPFLDFVSWHPKIKEAFRKGHAKGRQSPIQVVVKGASESPGLPFADILSCYIQDRFQNIPNLQSDKFKRIINNTKRSLKRLIP
jgi:hypothetical protein